MRQAKETPPQERLKEVLDYNPDSGIFTWRYRSDVVGGWNKNFAGKEAGTRVEHRINIFVDSVCYGAHRLAWRYYYGVDPSANAYVDHINCNCYDNRIANLRIASHGQNCTNSRQRKTKMLPKGVSAQRSGNSFRARIGVDKAVVYLGTYATPEEAHRAYLKAALDIKGAFARAG